MEMKDEETKAHRRLADISNDDTERWTADVLRRVDGGLDFLKAGVHRNDEEIAELEGVDKANSLSHEGLVTESMKQLTAIREEVGERRP